LEGVDPWSDEEWARSGLEEWLEDTEEGAMGGIPPCPIRYKGLTEFYTKFPKEDY
jgi:hypothetical protein